MRLSEEIILGGTLGRHLPRANYFIADDSLSGCALQLACLASGEDMESAKRCYASAQEAHPELIDAMAACPVCAREKAVIPLIVVHLNDTHKWLPGPNRAMGCQRGTQGDF